MRNGDVTKFSVPGQAEDPGHLFHLGVFFLQSGEDILVDDREDDEKRDEDGQILGGQPDQADDHKGGHRHGLDGDHPGPEQGLQKWKTRSKKSQQDAQDKSQQKAAGDMIEGKPDGGKKSVHLPDGEESSEDFDWGYQKDSLVNIHSC